MRGLAKASPRVNATGGVGAEGCFFKNSPLVHFVAPFVRQNTANIEAPDALSVVPCERQHT